MAQKTALVTGAAQGIRADVKNPGNGGFFVHTDVSREAAVRACVRAVVRKLGRLDALVNNAGLADPANGPLEKLALAQWNRRIGTNLTGVFLMAKHCAAHLRAARGAMVNIASTRALQSEPHTEAYAASKGGVLALSHALAMSLGPEVRVNCISPDIAALTAYLLSDAAGFVTGQNFIADGGMTRKMIYEK